MNDTDRIKILQNALDHQFDEDENAELSIETDDAVLLAAVDAVNRFGAWTDLSLAPDPDLFEVLGLVVKHMGDRT